MNYENKKIIVVEDEFITAADLIGHLEQMGFIVPASTDTGEEVLKLAEEHVPDLILMDINLKGRMNGIAAAEIIRENLDIPVIFLTGQSDEATIAKAIQSEPFGYIIKPFEAKNLKTTISMALYKHTIDRQVKASEIRYRQIAESTDNIVAIFNLDFSIDYINKAGSSLIQKKPEEIIGQKISDIFSSNEFDEITSHIQSVIHKSEKWRDTIRIYSYGREIWLDVTIIPLLYNLSTSEQLLLIARDISDWIRIQKAIEKEGIIQIEKNMERFQVLNDQIRNPLTLIAMCAAMDGGPSSEKIRDAVKIIDDLVDKLDQGWIESNKVRSFLLRHYRHGEDL